MLASALRERRTRRGPDRLVPAGRSINPMTGVSARERGHLKRSGPPARRGIGRAGGPSRRSAAPVACCLSGSRGARRPSPRLRRRATKRRQPRRSPASSSLRAPTRSARRRRVSSVGSAAMICASRYAGVFVVRRRSVSSVTLRQKSTSRDHSARRTRPPAARRRARRAPRRDRRRRRAERHLAIGERTLRTARALPLPALAEAVGLKVVEHSGVLLLE